MRLVLAVGAAAAGAFWWERTHPSAFPYAGRVLLEFTHPFITRDRLREVLEPTAGERILEVGPGTGYYALAVAEWIGPDGGLTVLDVQQEYLDHTMAAAAERGMDIEPVLASRGRPARLVCPLRGRLSERLHSVRMAPEHGRVLLALLICTDGGCALHYEAIGIPEELECLVCDSCGCALQAISWAEAAPNGARPAPLHLQLLGAA